MRKSSMGKSSAMSVYQRVDGWYLTFHGDSLWSNPEPRPSQAPQFDFEAVLAPLTQISHLRWRNGAAKHLKRRFNQQWSRRSWDLPLVGAKICRRPMDFHQHRQFRCHGCPIIQFSEGLRLSRITPLWYNCERGHQALRLLSWGTGMYRMEVQHGLTI